MGLMKNDYTLSLSLWLLPVRPRSAFCLYLFETKRTFTLKHITFALFKVALSQLVVSLSLSSNYHISLSLIGQRE